YQTNVVYRVANTLVLLGLKSFRGLPAAPSQSDDLFEKHVGLSAYEYVLTLFALWSVTIKDPLIDTRTFLQGGLRRDERMAAVGSVLSEISRPFDKYKDLDALPESRSYTGKARAGAFFSRWPLIRLNDQQFIAAAHPFVKIQIASKSMTKALALARAEEGKAST